MVPLEQPAPRLARTADVEALLELVRAFHAEDGHPYNRAVVDEALHGLLTQPARGCIWVLEADAQLVGYLVLGYGYSLEFHGVDAFVDELYLSEQYRGRGWGKRLLRHAEREARAAGVRALHLEVTRGNRHAQDLYERLGYRDHERFLMTKWLDGTDPHA